MATGVQVWSGTPVTNATVDTNINWAEGMAPSQVNDSSRALMASVAKFRDDNNGTVVTSGTTLAYTAATNQVEAGLTAGYTVAVQFHATNDSSATLAVDGLTAAPMQQVAGTNVSSGAFAAGTIQRFTYSTTGTGQWIVNSYMPPGGGVGSFVSSSTTKAGVTINTTSYVDVASVTLPSSGTWIVTANPHFFATLLTNCFIKITDTVTSVTAANIQIPANQHAGMTLMGVSSTSTFNILKVSARVNIGATIVIASTSDASADENATFYGRITAYRIA